MSLEVNEARIVEFDFDPSKTHASAHVELAFLLIEGADGVPGQAKRKVSVAMRKGAPEMRIRRRLISEAVRQQEAYFDGEELGSVNMFADLASPMLPSVANA